MKERPRRAAAAAANRIMGSIVNGGSSIIPPNIAPQLASSKKQRFESPLAEAALERIQARKQSIARFNEFVDKKEGLQEILRIGDKDEKIDHSIALKELYERMVTYYTLLDQIYLEGIEKFKRKKFDVSSNEVLIQDLIRLKEDIEKSPHELDTYEEMVAGFTDDGLYKGKTWSENLFNRLSEGNKSLAEHFLQKGKTTKADNNKKKYDKWELEEVRNIKFSDLYDTDTLRKIEKAKHGDNVTDEEIEYLMQKQLREIGISDDGFVELLGKPRVQEVLKKKRGDALGKIADDGNKDENNAAEIPSFTDSDAKNDKLEPLEADAIGKIDPKKDKNESQVAEIPSFTDSDAENDKLELLEIEENEVDNRIFSILKEKFFPIIDQFIQENKEIFLGNLDKKREVDFGFKTPGKPGSAGVSRPEISPKGTPQPTKRGVPNLHLDSCISDIEKLERLVRELREREKESFKNLTEMKKEFQDFCEIKGVDPKKMLKKVQAQEIESAAEILFKLGSGKS